MLLLPASFLHYLKVLPAPDLSLQATDTCLAANLNVQVQKAPIDVPSAA
jgi:hypothetical protein